LEVPEECEVFEEEDDFRQRILGIYLTHFLVEVFEEETVGEDQQNNEEKISNMIYILTLRRVFMEEKRL
jgi:hypothetical protein